jgi:hypothetical protein
MIAFILATCTVALIGLLVFTTSASAKCLDTRDIGDHVRAWM